MDPRTARYQAESEAAVDGLWTADHQRIRAAGWRQVGPARWTDDPVPTLLVDYEFRPPNRVRRWIACDAAKTDDVFADDAMRMAAAGYIPENQLWHGRTHSGVALFVFGIDQKTWFGPGELEIVYRYRPDLAGEPTRSIPSLPDERGPRWGSGPDKHRHHPIAAS